MQKILGKKNNAKKYDMGGKNNKSINAFAFSHNSSRECKHLMREQKASTYYFSSHIIFSFFTMSL